ncbi:malic enzyme [Raphidocelis subcapitata]|uniref:Malic enzyme n=1 Tax=Raphidocelis subcapitata TaxID=307507 RepID=A0A2V0PEP7_9CHLO|nr:malic enzyme [Raphidocelis subcapitata]|eukprot:GBF98314.1 malic enzyme [Raphidocelis subcapitata]
MRITIEEPAVAAAATNGKAHTAAAAAPAAAPAPPSRSATPPLPPRPAADGDEPSTVYEPPLQEAVEITNKRSSDILHDPTLNKGTAFPLDERERLGLRGLLPPIISNMGVQLERVMKDFYYGLDQIPPEEIGSGITREMERRWRMLQGLQDRNETLFYRVLVEHFAEMAPIVYTPTVGWVCTNYHKLWRRPRGMFFSAGDAGHMASMAYHWPQEDVQAIVVTDGSRILGLGDLGTNGLGIPIGKLDLYVAAAGFHPSKVLPCVIDVGTNNARLLEDPLYVGLRQPRLRGDAYYAVVDEFVRAVTSRWPQAVLQFEDFSIEHALPLLERYRHHHLVFNDDIQGTAATAVAGLYGALRALGLPPSALAQQRVVCLGAGSAGMGVVSMIADAMVVQGCTPEEARRNFWVLSSRGLITSSREVIPSNVAPFARPEGELEGATLLEVVRHARPTVLLGLAGVGRLFTREVLEAAGAVCERPIVFAMSNPTSKMECTAAEALEATEGRCVFASGSPQDPFEFQGRRREFGQANNLFLFPGMALGAYLGRTGTVTDGMFMKAAEAIPELIEEEDLAAGLAYPRIKSIRDISAAVAAAVIAAAHVEGRVANANASAAAAAGPEALLRYVKRMMYSPFEYSSLAYRPLGQ